MNSPVIKEDFFDSFDGTRIFYRFVSSESARETIIIVHGQGEHSGRYLKFFEYLVPENYAMAVMDLRGHGRSAGRHVYAESFECFLKDLTAFLNILQTRHGVKQKVCLMGHSLGGLIALHWVLKNSGRVNLLILSSPCFGLRLPPFLIAMNSFFNRFIPKMEYRNPVYPPHLTHNPQEMIDYKNDGLVQRKITVRLLSEMIDYCRHLRGEREISLPFPVYGLMADDMEKVVDPQATRAIFDIMSVPDKRLVTFPGFYHEIFNELEQKTAFKALRTVLRDGQEFITH